MSPLKSASSGSPFSIVTINYASLYLKDYREAIEFYSKVFGPPETPENELDNLTSFRTGSTWLTLFPAKGGTHPDSNPRNCEFAIQVATPDEVDRMHKAFVDAGAKSAWSPEDTWMYEDMRFSCIDDPFGVRIDIYCPIEAKDTKSVIARYYRAWIESDQDTARSFLADNLKFRSPDLNVDSADDFMNACWEYAASFNEKEVIHEVYGEHEAYYVYKFNEFCVGELIKVVNGKITEVYVTFNPTV